MSAGSPKAPCEPNATTRTIRLPTLSKRIVPPFTPAGGNIALRPARHRTDKPRAVLPQSIGQSGTGSSSSACSWLPPHLSAIRKIQFRQRARQEREISRRALGMNSASSP